MSVAEQHHETRLQETLAWVMHLCSELAIVRFHVSPIVCCQQYLINEVGCCT
jgi:hypothetical protein